MPEITNENQEQLKNKIVEEDRILDNVDDKNDDKNIANEGKEVKPEESLVSKAIKDAREKVANEVKSILKREKNVAKDSKIEDKIKNTENTKNLSNENLKNAEKEESVIQKIKNFIEKIILMQEESDFEADDGSIEKVNDKNIKAKPLSSNIKEKYMLEYYDLPYRYNETVVKILAQTPKRLFVYWDIADNDRKKFENVFGESFFNDTYPVLLVHNEEKNYTFEVPINDFANSWYLDINDPKSKYVIQLGRKFKVKPELINYNLDENSSIEILNDYIPITTSNILEVPNDHILFENLSERVLYRNIKTNEESYVDISNIDFINKIGTIYNVYDLYKEIYKNEIGEGSLTDLLNPSSMSSSGINSSMFR